MELLNVYPRPSANEIEEGISSCFEGNKYYLRNQTLQTLVKVCLIIYGKHHPIYLTQIMEELKEIELYPDRNRLRERLKIIQPDVIRSKQLIGIPKNPLIYYRSDLIETDLNAFEEREYGQILSDRNAKEEARRKDIVHYLKSSKCDIRILTETNSKQKLMEYLEDNGFGSKSILSPILTRVFLRKYFKDTVDESYGWRLYTLKLSDQQKNFLKNRNL